MIATTRRSELWRRVAVVAIIVGLHLVVAFVLVRPRDPARVAAMPPAISVTAIPASPEPRPVEQYEFAEPVPATTLPVPSFEITPSAGDASTTCDIIASVGRSIQADSATLAMLATTAGPERAMMAWNGGWDERPQTQLLRHTIDGLLRTVPAACLDDPQTGPRLAFVSIDGATITVAFGSGAWSWRSLLSNAEQ